MIKLVIFDMDGLMLDTEKLCHTLWPTVFTGMPVEVWERDYFSIVGQNRTNSIEYMERAHPGMDAKALFDDLVAVMAAHILEHGVDTKRGLHQLLDFLEQQGIPRVVASSSSTREAEQILKRMELWQRFNGFVFGDMVRNSKPDPEIFLLAAKKMGVVPTNCMVLEDSFAGVTAARRAGMVPVMIPDMVQPDESIREMYDHHCESLLEVIGLLRSECYK